MNKVVITAAKNFDNEAMNVLKKGISEKLTGEVAFSEKTDKTLLGGFIAEINDKIYDCSLSSKVNMFKNSL